MITFLRTGAIIVNIMMIEYRIIGVNVVILVAINC